MTDALAAAKPDVFDIVEFHEGSNGGAAVLIGSAATSTMSPVLTCIGAYGSLEALFADEEGLVFRGGSTFVEKMIRAGIRHARREVFYGEEDAKAEGKSARTFGFSMRECRYRENGLTARQGRYRSMILEAIKDAS